MGKVFLFIFKEQLKKRERRLTQDAQEKVRLDKEQALAGLRQEQWHRYETWRKKEDIWKNIFAGEPIDPVDWEVKLVSQPFIAPKKPETEYLLGQALIAVKMRFKPLLYFTLTVAGVFLYGFAVTEYAEDLWLYGIIGSMSALASLGLLGGRRITMKRAEEKVILFKRTLEEEYLQKQERALKEHEDREQERISRIDALLSGKTDAIEKVAYEHLLDAVNWPLGVSFRLQGVSAEVLELTITVPGLEMINPENARWDETKGVVHFSMKPLQESLKHYEQLISAITLRAGRETFRTCPTLKEVYCSVVTPKYRRTTGDSYEACILSVILMKAKFQAIDFAHMDYIHALENFKLRYAPSPQEFLGDVQPFMASEQPSELRYLDFNDLGTEQFEEVVKDLVLDTHAGEGGWEDGQGRAKDFAD
ncbi:MAG: hypothetical protein QMC95_14550 [Desulfitobacteriaceae bacterium]|nr:hypothetical protein [Desulfitobacteriaceae bacterium]MDI6915414.1 hypothetical protein [Desulfitobacteriaceae bacterium]